MCLDALELDYVIQKSLERALVKNNIHNSLSNLLLSSFHKKYVLLDPGSLIRLIASGDRRTMEFIHFLFEDCSKRGLTEETDRCVAMSEFEARITYTTVLLWKIERYSWMISSLLIRG